MAKVFDVAKYVLHKTGKQLAPSLQKLVYYCQAWSLAWDEVPLFNEEFMAWVTGPVCEELHKAQKDLIFVERNHYDEYNCYDFTKEQIKTMDAVIDGYKDMMPWELNELVKRERPWKETREKDISNGTSGSVIPKELIQEYYMGLIGYEENG